MLRQVPPLEAVEAFLTAAQARSFRAAAAALALSPSAFSRRIQLLERFVGTDLFDRAEPGAPLTRAGERYLAEIGPALESIRQATMALRGTGSERRLRLATSHSFAAEWLIPRLPELARVHQVDVVLTISRDPAILRTGEVELAVWGGPINGAQIGDMICPLDAVAVSAPRLASGRTPPCAIDQIASHRLLAVTGFIDTWADYMRDGGYTGSLPEIATYETNQLKYEAAVSGMGLALATPLLSERFTENGRLAACLPLRQRTKYGYVLHGAAPRRRARPVARDFIAWLKQEVMTSLDRFDRWHAASVEG